MGLTSKAKAKSVRGEIAFSTHTGQTLEVVREHAEGEEFFRGDQSKHGDPAEEDVVRLTTVLKECVIGRVTRSAVALTVRGRGAQGFVVPGQTRTVHILRYSRCSERRVQAGGVRRGAAILECKLTRFILVSSEI